MQMDPIEKINTWFGVWRAESKINKVAKSLSKRIPLAIRREFYIKTVVKGHKEYHKLLAKYLKEHKFL